MKTISAAVLKKRIDAGESIHMIDVREAHEREAFHIGGRHIPLGFLIQQLDQLDDWMDEEIVIYCRSGARSALAAEMMKERGFEGATNLTGGLIAWEELGK